MRRYSSSSPIASRSRTKDLNDFTRSLLYPDLEFDPGGLELLEVLDAGVITHAAALPVTGLPNGTFVRVPIARLGSGETRTLTLGFRTTVPRRYGTFGTADDQLTAIGGWYPSLVPLGADGTWTIGSAPPLADFDVTLTAAEGLDVILNGRFVPAGAPLLHATVAAVHYLTLVAAPRFVSAETSAGGVAIRYLYRPPSFGMRISFGPPLPDIVLETLKSIVLLRPPAVPAPPGELLVVAAPAAPRPHRQRRGRRDRQRSTVGGPGGGAPVPRAAARAGGVRRAPASAVGAPRVRPRLPMGERGRVAHDGRPLHGRRRAGAPLGLRLDRLCSTSSPSSTGSSRRRRSPYTGAFFAGAKEADPLHAEVWSVTDTSPPGRVVITKLRAQLDPPVFDPLLDVCAHVAAAAARVHGRGGADAAGRRPARDVARALPGDRLPGRDDRLQRRRGRHLPQHGRHSPRQLPAVPRARDRADAHHRRRGGGRTVEERG
jgi:hypothetical protein